MTSGELKVELNTRSEHQSDTIGISRRSFYKDVTRLVAKKNDEGDSVELAEWNTSDNGYPVSIRYSGITIHATNKSDMNT